MIQGNAGRAAGDGYGEVTVKTKWDAVQRRPDYMLLTDKFNGLGLNELIT